MPGNKMYESMGTFLRLGLQEFSSLKLVFAQSPAISQLPFKCSYQLLAAAVVSSPGKLSFFVFICLQFSELQFALCP